MANLFSLASLRRRQAFFSLSLFFHSLASLCALNLVLRKHQSEWAVRASNEAKKRTKSARAQKKIKPHLYLFTFSSSDHLVDWSQNLSAWLERERAKDAHAAVLILLGSFKCDADFFLLYLLLVYLCVCKVVLLLLLHLEAAHLSAHIFAPVEWASKKLSEREREKKKD